MTTDGSNKYEPRKSVIKMSKQFARMLNACSLLLPPHEIAGVKMSKPLVANVNQNA